MIDGARWNRRGARRGLWLALAGVTMWLAVQNSMLVMWFLRDRLDWAPVVARALVRVGLHLLSDLWLLPLAVLVGAALALSGPSSSGRRPRPTEVSRA